MKNYIIKYFDLFGAAGGLASAGGASAALGPVGIGLAGAQTALGIVQAIQGDKIYDKYAPKLKAFKTPEEIYKIANATTARAGGGLSPQTLQYLTGNADRALGSSLGAATRLGADPNDLSGLYDNYASTLLDIGNMNELENMKNFEKYLTGQQLLADNKADKKKS